MAAVLAFGGCGGAGTAETRSVAGHDSAGVPVVRTVGPDRPLAWSADTLRVLGGAGDGPESFYRVDRGTVGVDGAGRLYVWDGASARVAAFGPDGAHLWTAGRRGGGPGEIRSGNSLAVEPGGRAWVYDWGKSALVGFDSSGAPLPQIPFPHTPLRARTPHFAFTGGGVTVLRREPYTGSDTRRTEVLRVAGTDTAVLFSRVLPTDRTARFDECGMTFTLPVLFAPTLHWHTAGDRLLLNAHASYAVEVFTGAGETLRIERDLAPEPVSPGRARERYRELMERGMAGGCAPTADALMERIGHAPERQVITGLAAAPDGDVWVRRVEAERSRIDVFLPDGAYRGTLPPDFPFPIVFLPDGRIGARSRDEVDVERLVVVRVRR